MLSDRLKKIQKERKVTNTQVAEAIGMNENTYSGYLRNRTRMSAQTLREICLYFNITADYLLELTDIPYATDYQNDNVPEWLSSYYDLSDEHKIMVEERIRSLSDVEQKEK